MSVGAIHNLTDGRARRHSGLVVASILALFSAAGVVTRPGNELALAQAEHAAAERRVGDRRRAAEHWRAFEAQGGLTRAEGLLRALRARLPGPRSELELHGLLRWIAARSGVELERIEVLAAVDAGLEPLDDVAAVREVRVAAESPLAELRTFLAACRELGFPAILDFGLTRASAGRFRWSAALGLFESHPLSSFESGAPGDSP
jgi:hypothetical protein